MNAFSPSTERALEQLPESTASTCFSARPWLSHWLTHYARPGDRFLSSPRNLGDGRRVWLPLMIRRHRIKRLLSVRMLRFMGTGDAETDEVATEFPDIHLDGEVTPSRLDAVHALLCATPGWDLLRADNVLPGSVIAGVMTRAGAHSQSAGWRYLVSLEDGFEAWVGGLGKSTRSRVRRTLRAADAAGAYLSWYPPGELASEGLQCLVNLHTRRWQQKGDSGVFASPLFTAFHRSLLLDPHSGARIACLRTRRGPLACWYGFDHNGIRYFYQSGWQQDGDSFSPGIALHLMVIRDAVQSGLVAYDFMKAGDASWKARFATSRQRVNHYALPGHTLTGRMLGLALHASPHWNRCGEAN